MECFSFAFFDNFNNIEKYLQSRIYREFINGRSQAILQYFIRFPNYKEEFYMVNWVIPKVIIRSFRSDHVHISILKFAICLVLEKKTMCPKSVTYRDCHQNDHEHYVNMKIK